MKTLIISPHLDDAVFSCGGLIDSLSGDVTVLTVFAGFYRGLTKWDQQCGFVPSDNPMETRRQEDKRALLKLRCDNYIHLDFLQQSSLALAKLYRLKKYVISRYDFLDALRHAIAQEEDLESVYFPMGIWHPDHVRVREAVIRLMRSGGLAGIRTLCYEEFPYCRNERDYIVAVRALKQDLSVVEDFVRVEVDIERKIAAVLEYKSQLDGVFGAADGKSIRDVYSAWAEARGDKRVLEHYYVVK